MPAMTITRLYRTPGLSTVEVGKAVAAARAAGIEIDSIATEHCFYVASGDALMKDPTLFSDLIDEWVEAAQRRLDF